MGQTGLIFGEFVNTRTILNKRPVISIFVFYSVVLIILNACGYFAYEKMSRLYHFTSARSQVLLEGKIISEPQTIKKNKRFVLKTYLGNGNKIAEKVLVTCSTAYSIKYGDIICVSGKLRKPFSQAFPFGFDYQKYLARNEIYTCLNVKDFEFIKSDPSNIKKVAISFKCSIVEKIDAYFKKAYGDVLKSLLIGDASLIEPDIKMSFRNSGLMHILVVSGLHIGFVSIFIVFILKFLGLPFKKSKYISIPFIFFYCIVTGANPPALRAAIMFSCIIISMSLDREALTFNSIALSALIILLFQPQQLFTASFQMSYVATIAIVCFYPKISDVFSFIKNPVAEFFCKVLAITISAQLLLTPICAYYFGNVFLVSVLANIVVTPFAAIILYLGLSFYLISFIFPQVAALISILLSAILKFILAATVLFGNLKFASVLVAKPLEYQVIIFFIFLFCSFYLSGRRRIFILCTLILLFALWILCSKFYERNKVFFNFYDSGQNHTLQVKSSSKNYFILFSDNFGINDFYLASFSDFLNFSGVKNPQIFTSFSNSSRLFKRFKNSNVKTFNDLDAKIKLELPKISIVIDMKGRKILVNDKEFGFKNKKFFIAV